MIKNENTLNVNDNSDKTFKEYLKYVGLEFEDKETSKSTVGLPEFMIGKKRLRVVINYDGVYYRGYITGEKQYSLDVYPIGKRVLREKEYKRRGQGDNYLYKIKDSYDLKRDFKNRLELESIAKTFVKYNLKDCLSLEFQFTKSPLKTRTKNKIKHFLGKY